MSLEQAILINKLTAYAMLWAMLAAFVMIIRESFNKRAVFEDAPEEGEKR